jgi:hypothetical protein
MHLNKMVKSLISRDMDLIKFIHSEKVTKFYKNLLIVWKLVHCKFLPHENYGDWKLRGPCRENLHYLWKRAVRITKKPYVCCG